MTRVELYSSLDELTNASAIVATGAVVGQSTVRDIDELTEFTISQFRIETILKSDGVHSAGDTIEVRQLGGLDQNAPTPIISSGVSYLLYLTPSGLASPLDTHFYITGANAGLFASNDSVAGTRSASGEFFQVDSEPGERLPSSVDLQEAKRATEWKVIKFE